MRTTAASPGESRRSARRPEPLERYNAKRNFERSAEPAGKIRPSKSGRSFVVQKHAATALHYDFRLELDGVLLSWAVPKGPSLSPKDKRLAVQTEDHPVDYRDFEGTIPEGEYGGGTVVVWDRGTWEPIGDPHDGMRKGRLELSLNGEKLHGKYLLVRLAAKDADRGKQSWLLMKRRDEHAREGKEAEIVKRMPESVLTGRTIEQVKKGDGATTKLPPIGKVGLQLATLVAEPPTQGDWVYEIKYDGYRAVATLDHGDVRIASRNGLDWTDRFSNVAEALSRLRAKTAIFDGEIAYVMEDGRTDFQKLQSTLNRKASRDRLVYFVFDLLHYDGVDLTNEPLEVRKDKLRTILAGVGLPLRMGEHLRGDGRELLAEVCKRGLEGLIGKRADRPYRAGRGRDWVKLKCHKGQELVIVGWTPQKGQRVGLGALLLGVRDGKRKTYRYVGKVGTGFTNETLRDLGKRLSAIGVDEPTAEGAPRMKEARWVKPELVCEVRFTEWTRDGRLRHPCFLGLREDKAARVVERERESEQQGTGDRQQATGNGEIQIGGISISHADRIVEPSTGITKGEMARYSEVMAGWVLPFARKRPLMLFRCTGAWEMGELQGRRSKKSTCFVQKHMGRGLFEGVGRGDVDGEEVIYVTKERELVSLFQLNVVELHGWGARLPKIEKPDWIVLDLDPDVGLPFERVVEAAIDLRDELAKMGLTSFVKTTGGKGLHVVLPLTPKDDWDTVSAFATAVAHGMTARAPKRYVATMTKAARKGKIFIDHFRNGRGATAILPYSPRARPGAPVALPIAWEELPKIDPQDFTIRTVPEILRKRRVDPWEDLLTTKQTIPRFQ